MEMLDVDIFLAIVQTRSISRAAEVMHLSQSTISHRLKELEEKLGMRLLERNRGHKSINLTTRGEEFIAIAQKWVAVKEETERLKLRPSRALLTVAGVDSVNFYIFPTLYRRLFLSGAPLDLKIKTQHSHEIYSMMQTGEADLGFVSNDAQYGNIETKEILREPYRLLRLKRNDDAPKVVDPLELDPANEIFHTWNPEYQHWHDQRWNPSQHSPVWLNTPSMLVHFLVHESFWAIVPASVARYLTAMNPFTAHEILDPPPEKTVYCIKHRYAHSIRSRGLEIFLEHLTPFLDEYKAASL